MESKLLEAIEIDPGIILIAMFVLIIILFFIAIRTNMKYNRLKASYTTFMRGKNGKTLEDSIFEKFSELDNMVDTVQKNRKDIRELNKNVRANYQKVGIVKYDAFNEMGGKLSFAIALLDGKDSGFILNSMHSRDGCYNYVKEIVNGQSYIELSEEEAESLEKAMYQETFGLDLKNIKK